jgi:hypothetical protein
VAVTVAPQSSKESKRHRANAGFYPAVPSRRRVLDVDGSPPPFLTISCRWNNSTLRFFSTLTTFGSPQDVPLQEMRIETFFLADEATRAALTASR